MHTQSLGIHIMLIIGICAITSALGVGKTKKPKKPTPHDSQAKETNKPVVLKVYSCFTGILCMKLYRFIQIISINIKLMLSI